MKRTFMFLLVFFSFLYLVNIAFADPVDLSTFVGEPDDPTIVDIRSDTITFYESTDYGYLYAANDSFFVPDNALTLSYEYSLVPGLDDYDWLVLQIDGAYEMEIGYSGAGTYSIDMTPYLGQTIRLAFGLEYDSWDDWGFDSTGTISNIDLAIASSGTEPVPEPATMLLLGSGLVGLAGMGRKKFFKKS